jgi:acetyl-CoA carboxylase biotin carboxylase subunit
MRIVRGPGDLAQAFRAAQAEAQAAFGVPDVYIERYVEGPRHIEVQVMADSKGNVVHLGERECSIQRRHQKIIEEAPSTVVSARLRKKIGKTAVEAAAAVQYVNAGTIEFLLDDGGNFYFMEMNTRIQVEHGVTELVTGRDLVKEHFHQPGGPGVRVDTFAHEGCDISPYYDSMIAKLMTHGRDRAEAIARMKRCLEMMVVEGIRTNIALHRRILDDADFVAGRFDTRFMERFLVPKTVTAAS